MYKPRVPAVAVASLVFGGGACGGDDAHTTETQEARQQRIVEALCAQERACFPEDAKNDPGCEADYSEAFDSLLKNANEACRNAMFDFYECYGELECEQLSDPETDDVPDACASEGDAYKKACPEITADD